MKIKIQWLLSQKVIKVLARPYKSCSYILASVYNKKVFSSFTRKWKENNGGGKLY